MAPPFFSVFDGIGSGSYPVIAYNGKGAFLSGWEPDPIPSKTLKKGGAINVFRSRHTEPLTRVYGTYKNIKISVQIVIAHHVKSI